MNRPFAISLAGCDFGTSGMGVFARAVIPRLVEELSRRGRTTAIIASARERAGIGVSARDGVVIPGLTDSPAPNALFSIAGLPVVARSLRAAALYLPGANRRLVGLPLLPTVGTVHDLAQFHVEGKYGRLRDVYIRRFLTPMLGRLTRVLAVSQATADDIVKYAGVPRDRIRVVPNGITLAEPPATRAPWRRPYLLYPARLEHPGKNHLRLIEAFARSKAMATHDLLLPGKDWGAQAMIEHAIRQHGLQDRVTLLGFVSREELMGRMLDADGVVVAGLFEGFGLQVAEALALGKPVACSNTGSLPEVAGGLGASFDPLDAASIARALDLLVSDEGLRRECADRGPGHASKYSWSACVTSIADALEEVGLEAS